jgi:hypothetical protein
VWPDAESSCAYRGWLWLGVALYLASLAPQLAPCDLVSLANVRMIEHKFWLLPAG